MDVWRLGVLCFFFGRGSLWCGIRMCGSMRGEIRARSCSVVSFCCNVPIRDYSGEHARTYASLSNIAFLPPACCVVCAKGWELVDGICEAPGEGYAGDRLYLWVCGPQRFMFVPGPCPPFVDLRDFSSSDKREWAVSLIRYNLCGIIDSYDSCVWKAMCEVTFPCETGAADATSCGWFPICVHVYIASCVRVLR